MFAITVAGDGDEAVHKVSSVLRGRRFRVETLVERRASLRRSPTDALVVVTPSGDRMQVTRVVLDARRDDDVRFVPFALVARSVERSAASAIGAKALVRYDGSPEELVTEIRRMLLREQESAVLVHQLEGEIGALRVGDMLETLGRGRRDAVLRIACGSSRGAVRVRAGLVVAATFDALHGREALAAMLDLAHGRFRVELRTVDDTDEIGALDAETARAILERQKPAPAAPPKAQREEQAPLAALAAALGNAVTAHARRWLTEAIVAAEVEGARRDAMAEHPSLAAFRVSEAGIVLVESLRDAANVGGLAMGAWIGRALERLERTRPGRFGRGRVDEVVGGLGRLLEQVGWKSDFARGVGGQR